jgi:hypothetical protein
MQLQKTNEIPTALKPLSQSELSKALDQNNFKVASELLPTTIDGAIDCPPLCDLIRLHGDPQIRLFIEFELICLNDLVSVGKGLNSEQVQFIAGEFVRMYPNETLADFKLCFRRGAIGRYGEIFRLDGVVIGQWMKTYLEEKYQVIEEKLRKEKDNIYAPVQKVDNSEKHQYWLDKWKEDLDKASGKKPAPLTDKEILHEGQIKPKHKPYNNGYTLEFIELQDRIRRAASDFYGNKPELTSYKHLKVFLVKEHEVFAASEKDAIEIYLLAIKKD